MGRGRGKILAHLIGWISVHREVIDSKLWSCSDATFRVAMYLLLSANHKQKYHRRITIERGQCVRSLTMISDDCNLSRKAVRHALKILSKDEFISLDEPFGAQQGHRITICKYNKWQDKNTDEGTEGANEGANEGATNNNDNNDNNDNNEKKKEEGGSLDGSGDVESLVPDNHRVVSGGHDNVGIGNRIGERGISDRGETDSGKNKEESSYELAKAKAIENEFPPKEKKPKAKKKKIVLELSAVIALFGEGVDKKVVEEFANLRKSRGKAIHSELVVVGVMRNAKRVAERYGGTVTDVLAYTVEKGWLSPVFKYFDSGSTRDDYVSSISVEGGDGDNPKSQAGKIEAYRKRQKIAQEEWDRENA